MRAHLEEGGELAFAEREHLAGAVRGRDVADHGNEVGLLPGIGRGQPRDRDLVAVRRDQGGQTDAPGDGRTFRRGRGEDFGQHIRKRFGQDVTDRTTKPGADQSRQPGQLVAVAGDDASTGREFDHQVGKRVQSRCKVAAGIGFGPGGFDPQKDRRHRAADGGEEKHHVRRPGPVGSRAIEADDPEQAVTIQKRDHQRGMDADLDQKVAFG